MVNSFSTLMSTKIYVVFSLFFMMIMLLNNPIFAEDLLITEECINNKLTLTVSSSDEPVENASVYIYEDSLMKKINDKVITDSKGQVEFQFSDRTSVAKITKEQHDDFIQTLSCNEVFRNQTIQIFSVVDSSVGIIEDPATKLTIVDLGSFYGVAGNGTIPDKVQVFRDNTLWKTIAKETGITPSTSHSEWQIPQTAFFNELPGRYELVLITNNTETLVYEFIVKQITEYDENSFSILDTSNMIEDDTEKLFETITPPLKQIANGILSNDVVCSEGLQLILKMTNNSPACVKSTTVEKLIERGWAHAVLPN